MKALTFLLSLIPIAYIGWQVYQLSTGGAHALGADPGKEIVLFMGQWSINFLLLTLAVTPVRKITGWNQIQKIRRMLGLFTFFYVSLHLTSYLVLLLELNFSGIWADIIERPYITVGFVGFLLLVPLAVTSTQYGMRKLGKNWVKLHRAVYLIAILAVVHVLWIAKSSYTEAFLYGFIALLLLLARVFEGKLLLFRGVLRTTS